MASKTITLICANDSIELAFHPDVKSGVIEKHKKRITKKLTERYKHTMHTNIYVHYHTVEFCCEGVAG